MCLRYSKTVKDSYNAELIIIFIHPKRGDEFNLEKFEMTEMENKAGGNKRFPWTLWFCVITADLLNVTTGLSMVWPSAVLEMLHSTDPEVNPLPEPLKPMELSIMMASSGVASLISFFVMAKISDRIGRRLSMRYLGIVYAGTFVAMGYGRRVYVYVITFFINGLAAAGIFINVSIYTGEISDDRNRALIGCLFGLMTPVGNFLGYSFAAILNSVKLFSLICTIPAIVHVVLTFFIVESPTFLVGKNKKDEAILVIKKLRHYTNISDAEKEYENIVNFNSSSNKEQKTISDLVHNPISRRALLLGFTLLSAQQFTGTNTIINYVVPIFNEAGASLSGTVISILLGLAQMVVTIVATSTVHKFGRRPLLLLSSCMCTVLLFCLTFYFYIKDVNVSIIDNIRWLPIVCVITFFVGYGLGLAPIPVVLVGELFRNEIRAVALAVVVVAQCTLTIIISFGFPIVSESLGIYTCFLVFSIGTLVCLVLIYRYVPETRGKSFQEIQDILSGLVKS
uniref:Facilitated trehalose transporter Tret1-like isoform X2 n=1 Tax=Diabrotica virgifera virgifera TaxID=50390 RepID=A0A6P7G8Q7_DIAVI